ncbi:hypothetical protein [Demequina sp. NBRC 110053]|uniref:hypothetical protein n=1 Tax=Demequina sp. NBRC 110053 TaxID=1570342 RepID=UPI000A05FDA6|nr:hypothetical protein [Demequina sp. NBRC 110053]
MNNEPFDPFADVQSDPDPTPASHRAELLHDAQRGYAQIRKVFVQQPNTSAVRPSLLAKFVTGRKERALDAFLLLHALQPILEGTPLPLSTWARVLSSKTVWQPGDALRAFRTLEGLRLVSISGGRSRPTIAPLLEDGSGSPWTRPGSDTTEEGTGYFTIPFEYWTTGLADRLALPGKAVFLITLKETQNPKNPAFNMAYERASDWYGISERSVERGFAELSRENVLLTRTVRKSDARHPLGMRSEHWRALDSPYSSPDRQRLQAAAQSAITRRRPSP